MTTKVMSIPVLHIRGTHYDVGFGVGEAFASKVDNYFRISGYTMTLRKFYASEDGRLIYERYLKSAEAEYPQYVEEIRGFADGSKHAFHDIFLWNMVAEVLFAHDDVIKNIEENTSEGGGEKCTSVYVNSPTVKLLAHNEDGEKGCSEASFIVNATIIGEPDVSESTGSDSTDKMSVRQRFVSHTYAGLLAGGTFGMSEHFVITCNTVTPLHCNPNGVPIAFTMRHILSCTTIDEIVRTAYSEPRGSAYGYNLNIAAIDGSGMWSMEVASKDDKTQVSLQAVPVPDNNTWHYFHQNHYKHCNAEEPNKPKSFEGTLARAKRCDELPHPASEEGIRMILGDTENKRKPVYRIPSPTDGGETACTALFNITERKLDVYKGNPNEVDACASLGFL